MGFEGPIDIMHEAIHKAMDLYEVENKKQCFEKVLVMARVWIKNIRKK